MSAATMALNKQ